MHDRLGAGLLAAILATGCGDSTPTQPTGNPGPGDATGPTARLVVTIDSLGSREAVAALSEVTLDASGSTGTGLSYRVDFGDGTIVEQPTTRHVYSTPGTFSAAVTVTDASGRSAMTSQSVAVASPLGSWTYSGYLPRRRSVEVRTLILNAQDARTVRGVLRSGSGDQSVTGSLSGERRIRLSVEGANETLDGMLPGVLTGESSWELTASGGPADGERLAFLPLRGEASGPPPDAVLKMRFFSFSAPFAIQGFSPILFDGSTSRGEGLRYFIEFGDREFSTESSAVHPIATAGTYTARLTVVDSLGRSDQEAIAFHVLSLAFRSVHFWLSPSMRLDISSQEAAEVRGTLSGGTLFGASFSGTLSGEHDIRLKLDRSEIVLTGTVDLHGPFSDWRLVLTQRGGAGDGQTYEFHPRAYN